MIPGAEGRFGGRVRELRTARGWSQGHLVQELARLGWVLHQQHVSKLEAGRRHVRLAEAEAIAAAFGMSLAAVLDDDAAAAERALRERIAAQITGRPLYPPGSSVSIRPRRARGPVSG